ncbi:MAG: hypothetical protein EU530_00825 [Promethearchaeota archaeon]|nr:MAG: hypothetical protein EU530_00825 [Candidatus Lokiarchaeota archaeon]
MERLFCPDFSSVFGQEFADPFLLPNIDTQIWPIFEGIKNSPEVEKLLQVKTESSPSFYRRKITPNQLTLELETSSIQFAILQALELGKSYGISNLHTLKISKKIKNTSVVCSIYPEKDGLSKLKEDFNKNKKSIIAFVIYPFYQSEFLKTVEFDHTLNWLREVGLPIKIDFTNLHLVMLPPITPEKMGESLNNLFKKLPSSSIILSCGEWDTLTLFIDRYKFQRNVFIELNLRMLGGQSPTNFFKKLFTIPGFIQNWWDRILLASSSPTLETSQLVRGWYEATSLLEMNFRHLLRIWGFRNGNRIFNIKPLEPQRESNFSHSLQSKSTNSSAIHLGYDIFVQSSAITQLISIQSVIEEILQKTKENYPSLYTGTLTIKSYHTTVSLLVNEHEIGNYLELHYHFVKESMADSQNFLHTLAAKENRADFNFPDHLLASKYGERSISYQIRNGIISRGLREHVYVLGTFGPRRIRIGIDVILNKAS